ncbi:hypothetical protein UFOVP257_275 [uncultured Caudovirales phage]|uniref:Uncharacterized protein n=1 Tax=uncultured Caudovirales phage TaxID=2100421 RepID=A0A6J5LJN6_9CAUD|nr:hypothetical protein UFOVP257_275 [uncultured Caudovirales phage]
MQYHYNINLPVVFNPIDIYPSGTVFSKTVEMKIDNVQIEKENFELVAWLKSLGLCIEGGRYFESTPHVKYKIHVDSPDSVAVKLNFIYSSFNSEMIWYELLPNQTGVAYTNISDEVLPWYEYNQVKEVYKVNTDTHCLINAGAIHQLINSDNHGVNRKCYSLKLQFIDKNKKLTWDNAVEILKEYVGS